MVISEDQELLAVGDCELVGEIMAGLPRQHTVIANSANNVRSISQTKSGCSIDTSISHALSSTYIQTASSLIFCIE